MKETKTFPATPVMIQDNTLRDGHQSIYATRMKTEDMIPIAEEMDQCGFWAMEVWGGATFDTMHRFLGEDPWSRPRILKKYVKKTPFTMLLRGQNLVGYRHYADDVVRAFVDKSCEIGIDIFRCFDALNDFRNIETCVERVKANGKHVEGTVCYSLTGSRLGGEIYTLDFYVAKARELESMGADTICIKDMAGLLSPYDAYDLFTALKKRDKSPSAPAHPLHQRHGQHDLPKSHRGGSGYHRYLPGPLCSALLHAGDQADRRPPSGAPKGHGHRTA